MRTDRISQRLALATLALYVGCGEPSRFGTLPDAGGGGPTLSFLPADLDVEAAHSEGWTDIILKLIPSFSINGGEGSPKRIGSPRPSGP